IQNSYRPGYEVELAAGVSYNKLDHGALDFTPILQMLVSERGRDGGAAGNPQNTGYSRLLVAPGVAIGRDAWKLYADVEVPVYQHMNGNQLIAPVAVKFIASYNF
ncbi:MAG TPA: hypothetical protein VN154_05320, partial [Rhizomicrobium sp.]|nr:hypothetical protein [Rhizomicrobium sp.]